MPWWNWLLPWKWVDLWRGPVSDPEPAQTASPVATSKAPWLADTSIGSSEAAVAQTVPTESSNTDTSTSTEAQQTSQERQELQDQIATLQETVEELEEKIAQVDEASDQESDPESSGASANSPMVKSHTAFSETWGNDEGIEKGKANESLTYTLLDNDGISRSEIEDAFEDFAVANTVWQNGYDIELVPHPFFSANGHPGGWEVKVLALDWSSNELGTWPFTIELTDAAGNRESYDLYFRVFPEGTGDEGYAEIDHVDRTLTRGETDELVFVFRSNMGWDVSEITQEFETTFTDGQYFEGGFDVVISDTALPMPFSEDTYQTFTVAVSGQVSSVLAADEYSPMIRYDMEELGPMGQWGLSVEVA